MAEDDSEHSESPEAPESEHQSTPLFEDGALEAFLAEFEEEGAEDSEDAADTSGAAAETPTEAESVPSANAAEENSVADESPDQDEETPSLEMDELLGELLEKAESLESPEQEDAVPEESVGDESPAETNQTADDHSESPEPESSPSPEEEATGTTSNAELDDLVAAAMSEAEEESSDAPELAAVDEAETGAGGTVDEEKSVEDAPDSFDDMDQPLVKDDLDEDLGAPPTESTDASDEPEAVAAEEPAEEVSVGDVPEVSAEAKPETVDVPDAAEAAAEEPVEKEQQTEVSADVSEGVSEDVVRENIAAGAEDSGTDILDSDELESILATATEQVDEELAASTDESELPEEAVAEADGDAEAEEPSEAASEEPLADESVAEEPEDEAELPAEAEVESEPVAADASEIDVEADESEAEAVEPEIEADAEPVAESAAAEVAEVAEENEAAAGVTGEEDLTGVPSGPTAEETEEEEEPRKRGLHPIAAMWAGPILAIGAIFQESPIRFIASLAAGLFGFYLSALFLMTNSFQPFSPDVIPFVANESDVRLRVEQAREYMHEGEYDNAVEILSEALENVEPGVEADDARYLRVEAMYKSLPEKIHRSLADDLHGEIDHLIENASDHPDAPRALYWKAKLYELEDNLPAARFEYRNIMENFGDAVNRDEVLLAFAELELKTNRPEEAGQAVQQLLKESPSSPLAARAHLLRADAYAALGDVDDALALYVRTVDEEADSPVGAEAFERLGHYALESDKPELAINQLEKRLDMATTVENNDRVHLLLARAYRSAERHDDAHTTLREIIEFFPESEITPDVYIELSQVLREQGELSRAVREATEAVNLYPKHPNAALNLGRLYQEKGNLLEAADIFVTAHRVGANDAQALFDAADLYEQRESLPRARSTYEELVNDFPGTPHAYEAELRWARVVNRLGYPSTAIERLEELLLTNKLDGTWPRRVLSSMAPIYEDMGLTRKAADIQKRIAEKSTDHTVRAKAAIVLLGSDTPDDGLRLAAVVDENELAPELAYDFLQAYGGVLLRGNDDSALEILERAHANYPEQRHSETVQRLLEANLVLGKTARARMLVTELAKRVQKALYVSERPLMVDAAVTWGDYLFDRGDYSGSIDAYSMALPDAPPVGEGSVDDALTEQEFWAANQQAAAMVRLERFDEAQPWLAFVAASNSPWAEEAAGRSADLALRERLRPPVVSKTESNG